MPEATIAKLSTRFIMLNSPRTAILYTISTPESKYFEVNQAPLVHDSPPFTMAATVIGHNMKRHRHQEFIRFLNTIEAQVPKRKAIHAIVDNYATHKHPKVRAWLARHPRWTFHFTPTSRILAQRRRGLVRQTHAPAPDARHLPIRRRP
jgi:hypothetical protein